MALNIKDEETDRLARELAAETGQSITDAVREAIEDRLATLRRQGRPGYKSDLLDVIARGRARRVIDNRCDAEILGYDQDGLPT